MRSVKTPPRFEVKAPAGAPNVVIVLIDDLGFGAHEHVRRPDPRRRRSTGSAQDGLRYNNFHTTALCSPTRAALKSGRNHHVNMGSITEMATGVPGQHRPDPQQRRARGRDAAAERLQHRRLRQVARDGGLGDERLRPVRPLADRARASTSSTASSAARPTSGRRSSTTASRQVELPHDPKYHFMTDMTDKAIAWIELPEGADAGQAVLRLLRAGRHARAAPRAAGVDRQVEGQVRPGLGQAARGDAGAPDRSWASCRRARSSRRSPRRSRTGTTLSADEKRLFAHQAEVFAAFVEYDRPRDRPDARGDRRDRRRLDNTLVFYIAGDNGTSAEGGANGMFNEYTYFNGVARAGAGPAEGDRQVGRARDLPAHGRGLGGGVRHAFRVDQAGRVELRRHAQRHGGPLAEGHQGEERDPHASSTT